MEAIASLDSLPASKMYLHFGVEFCHLCNFYTSPCPPLLVGICKKKSANDEIQFATWKAN
jgi:hypothetical protein